MKKELEYDYYHKKRIDLAWGLIDNINPRYTLEIGAWELTRRMYRNNMLIDTMGYYDARVPGWHHTEFNLSDLPKHSPVMKRKYNLVVCCEVLEHLPVSMETIFEWLNSLLLPNGKVLIQTPNGVCLKHRISMLFGKNPFKHIKKTDKHDHDHIREYTIKELCDYAEKAGFKVILKLCDNYFSYSHSWKARLYYFVCTYFFPSSFQDGITIVIKKI